MYYCVVYVNQSTCSGGRASDCGSFRHGQSPAQGPIAAHGQMFYVAFQYCVNTHKDQLPGFISQRFYVILCCLGFAQIF